MADPFTFHAQIFDNINKNKENKTLYVHIDLPGKNKKVIWTNIHELATNLQLLTKFKTADFDILQYKMAG